MSYIGNNKIGGMYLGSTKISKAYLGTDLVYQSVHVPKQYTLTVYPSSYDTEHHNWYSISNASRAYTSSSSTTYARIVNGGSYAEAYVYFIFDTSSIPDGATIDSVECSFKCTMTGNSTTTPQKKIQLFCGTTAKGTAMNGTTSATTRTIEDCGSWTLAEIRDIRIRAYTKAGSTTSRYNIDFYGATLTIKYSY